MNTFGRLLLAQIECIDAFVAALEAEDEALSQGRLHELPALTERKNAALAQLAQADQAREAAQAALGHEHGRVGAAAAAAADGVESTWSAVLAAAERARELNGRVAAKVYAHLDYTAQALTFLRSDRPPLYGRDGIRSAGGGGTTLGKR